MIIQIAVSVRAVIMIANRVHRVREGVHNQVVYIPEIASTVLTQVTVAWVKILMICKKVVLDTSVISQFKIDL